MTRNIWTMLDFLDCITVMIIIVFTAHPSSKRTGTIARPQVKVSHSEDFETGDIWHIQYAPPEKVVN